MGQGRRFPHFWRCIILIATAIQGITLNPKLFEHYGLAYQPGAGGERQLARR